MWVYPTLTVTFKKVADIEAELILSICATNVGSPGIQLPISILPPLRETRTKSNNHKTEVAVGQTFIQFTKNLQNASTLGFFSRYLLPPFQLKVIATLGDLPDRIKISWEIVTLGPSPIAGFNLYRDDVFLVKVGANIRSYNDFKVIPGQPYNRNDSLKKSAPLIGTGRLAYSR